MKTREEKAKIIEELKDLFKRSKGIIFLNLKKINSEIQFSLRKDLKKAESFIKVVKKTLIELANPNISKILDSINTPFAIVFDTSENYDTFKIIKDYSKKFNLEVLKGMIDNEVLDEKKVIEIGSLPSKEDLLRNISGTFKSSFNRLIFALKFPIIKIEKVVNNIKK
ncbi:MAG: 50S ribosomal protein L10 [Minisyncoccia bacterium]